MDGQIAVIYDKLRTFWTVNCNARRVMSEANYRRVGSPLKILTVRGPTRAKAGSGPIVLLVLPNIVFRAGIL
jgi:hypothetical protein